jgi:phosphopantothenoylcysteine decarboxylase/phosphopantothenate--cysteine ligase
MYENPVTQDNIERLRHYGWEIVDPATGRLACGTSGKGRLPEPEDLLEVVLHALAHEKDLSGKRVLVTAGPTQESLDPVRYLTNHSSGRMGYAIANAAARRGAAVTLVSGPTALKKPAYVNTVDVITAEDMFRAVMQNAPDADIIIKAAAVADYRPKTVADNKLKKSDDAMSIPLERTKDILGTLGGSKREGQFLCGFSMETEHMLENSRKKLEKKNLDMIAANNVKEPGAGFAVETNVLTLITKDGETSLPLMSKDDAANALLDAILKQL